MDKNVIYSINGPVVKVKGAKCFSMLEMVHVGHARLIGEVIAVTDRFTTIQVYESTAGLMAGEPVIPSGGPLCALLGPGLLTNIFDGILRPLKELERISGAFIDTGINATALDEEKKWNVTMKVAVGDVVKGGQIFAVCDETPIVEHRSLVPPDISGEVVFSEANGSYTVAQILIKIKTEKGDIVELALAHEWPIRTPRPIGKRLPMTRPLITGQRVIDVMYPIAKGGTAAIPGGFGTGKTMTQHQLAKWSDADIIVYVGCGERGNEMTQVLEEFGELVDPRTGRKLTDRTILIANTSNMPVAAREASIYTGITLAEYYRDMGYHVAIMADSTSRWAEALREISGRLEEIPAEEGFPAYLPSRLAQFYERAGYIEPLAGGEGSITIIGAVSPQGSDFSEPVTQNTKRFVRCFWALDKALAYARHYPSIDWLTSYTEYIDDLAPWYRQNIDPLFIRRRREAAALLQEESKLNEIVKLVGADVLPDDQKLVLEAAKLVRVSFLQQNAYHKEDTYVPLDKQFKMLHTILHLYEKSKVVVGQGVPVSTLLATGLFERLSRMKYDIPNDRLDLFDEYNQDIDTEIGKIK